MTEETVMRLAESLGGKIEEMHRLPDGSGFATMSMPLPKDHWLTASPDDFNVPPMPFRMGDGEHVVISIFPAPHLDPSKRMDRMSRQQFADKIREAGKYAVRSATMNGKEMDFDPDALLQNLIVGMLGYWTVDGLTDDEWANPPFVPEKETRWQVKQRMDFISETLQTAGKLNRADLMSKFYISTAQASKDIRDFLEKHPNAMVYDKSEKTYISTLHTNT